MRKRKLSEERQLRKELAESDLEEFIKLVQPKRVLGNIHREVIRWWTRKEAKSHQLLLLPRDHQKSALIAFRSVWELTKDPTLKILYISSTSNLATKQLKFMKDIMTSDVYQLFWPDMVNKEEAKREKWTEREISVDHPQRKEWSVREPSIFTAGLTTNVVGLHCDIAVLDDVVVAGNVYTQMGRDKTKEQYGYLSSVESTNAKEWVVGTRYHPHDLFSDLQEMEITKYNSDGDIIDREPLFEVFQRQVESVGDGTGQFLWPKQRGAEGRWFGFDAEALDRKRSQYVNRLHFRAQYYNDPHDVDSSPISQSLFQYYEPGYLSLRDGRWYFKGERLNVAAAVDFAYSTGDKSDYTTIAVLGADYRNNYYILDIDRFRTDKISDYFNRILRLHERWGFRSIRMEVTAAQVAIVKDLKENYIRPLGLPLAVEEFRPMRWQGSKDERILAILEPKYANHQIWHNRSSGNTQILEEELTFANPAHDDVKDALASAIDFIKPPTNFLRMMQDRTSNFQYHAKFGGVM